jgi:hypothetical protein
VADLATSEDMLRRQLLAERAANAGEWGGSWLLGPCIQGCYAHYGTA